jgi:hypothetical protein
LWILCVPKRGPNSKERPQSTGSKIMFSLSRLLSFLMLGVDSCFYTRKSKKWVNSGEIDPFRKISLWKATRSLLPNRQEKSPLQPTRVPNRPEFPKCFRTLVVKIEKTNSNCTRDFSKRINFTRVDPFVWVNSCRKSRIPLRSLKKKATRIRRT